MARRTVTLPIDATRATRANRVVVDAEPAPAAPVAHAAELLAEVEARRREVTRRLDAARRSEFGQILTPLPVACLLAGLTQSAGETVRVLDAGAGVGSLTAALVAALAARPMPPRTLHVTAVERDAHLVDPLQRTLDACRAWAATAGIAVETTILARDFLTEATAAIQGVLFGGALTPTFDCIITHPPQRALTPTSPERRALRRVGLDAASSTAAFLGLASRLLVEGGELLALTPRSAFDDDEAAAFRQFFASVMRVEQRQPLAAEHPTAADTKAFADTLLLRARRVAA